MRDLEAASRPRRDRRRVATPTASLVLALAALAPAASAIEIVFDYSYDESGFFDAAVRRAALEEAARHYAACLEGDLAPLPADGWVAIFRHPSESWFLRPAGPEIPRKAVLVFVGARPLAAEGRLATGGPGHLGFPCQRLLGRAACFDAAGGRAATGWVRDWVLRHGFRSSAAARALPATDFAPWGGSLTFASDADWHFDPSEPVAPDRYDFVGSAIHELGHVLGVGVAESWATHVSGPEFRGPEAVALRGAPVSLRADLVHWSDDTTGEAEGARMRAAFTAGQARGERRRLTDLDCAALRDIGWRAEPDPEAASDPIGGPYGGARIKGDVNGDGMVDAVDAARVRAALEGGKPPPDPALSRMPALLDRLGLHFWLAWTPFGWDHRRPGIDPDDAGSGERPPLDDPRAFAAADVFPMLDGEAVGDGRVDAQDLLLLEDVADDHGADDADGDGLASADENLMNWLVWMPFVGRPRHGPLTRWTDACLAFGVGRNYLDQLAGLSIEFCSRDGSPWSLSAALSPEEALATSESAGGAAPEPSSGPAGELPAGSREDAGLRSATDPATGADPAPDGVLAGGAIAGAPSAMRQPSPGPPPAAELPGSPLGVDRGTASGPGIAVRGAPRDPSRGGSPHVAAAGGGPAPGEPRRTEPPILAATLSDSPRATVPAAPRAPDAASEADAARDAPGAFVEWLRAVLHALARAVGLLVEWVRSW